MKYSRSKKERMAQEAYKLEPYGSLEIWKDEEEKEKVPYGVFSKHIHFGNTKLGEDVAVFNLGSAKKCPSKAKGLCKVCNECYALTPERRYGTPFLYRERQKKIWENMTPEEFAEYTIQKFERRKKK